MTSSSYKCTVPGCGTLVVPKPGPRTVGRPRTRCSAHYRDRRKVAA